MESIIVYHRRTSLSRGVDTRAEAALVEHIHTLGYQPRSLLSAELEQSIARGVATVWVPAIVLIGIDTDSAAVHQLSRLRSMFPLATLIRTSGGNIYNTIEQLPSSLSLWKGTRPNALCRAIVRSIYAELHKPTLSLSTLAQDLGYSAERIEREFREWRHEGLWRFVMDCRLEQACRLLQTTDLQVAEVGQAIGYWDKSVFSRTFKKITGDSPRHWRRRDTNEQPILPEKVTLPGKATFGLLTRSLPY